MSNSAQDNEQKKHGRWALALIAIRLILTPKSSSVKQAFLDQTRHLGQPSAWARFKSESEGNRVGFFFIIPMLLAFFLVLFISVGNVIGGRKLDFGQTWIAAASSDIACSMSPCPPIILNVVNASPAQLNNDIGESTLLAIRFAKSRPSIGHAMESKQNSVILLKEDRIFLIETLRTKRQLILDEREAKQKTGDANKALLSFLELIASGSTPQEAAKKAISLRTLTLSPMESALDEQIGRALAALDRTDVKDITISPTATRVGAGMISAWNPPSPSTDQAIALRHLDEKQRLEAWGLSFFFLTILAMLGLPAFYLCSLWMENITLPAAALAVAKETWEISHSSAKASPRKNHSRL